jgi:all-trans-retinol 13,14-reductase
MERPARKPRYWSKKAPEDRTWDTIVIGSGIGGMTTAAILAKLGERVLLLEQHYVPGGYTHTFRRKGYEWDVGVHIVGETSQRSLPGRLMHHLGNGEIQWEPVGPIYDQFHFPDEDPIPFHSNPHEFKDTLKSRFPHQSRNIDAYMEEVRHTVKVMRNWYVGRALPGRVGKMFGGFLSRNAVNALQTTVDDALAPILTDDKLRSVVNAQWGYHGSPPSEASWALQALVVRHFAWGAAYPVGGASTIARGFLRTVAESGGWTRIVADVDQILVEGGRAVGVRMADGEQIRAKRIVSAAGAWTTVTRFLPDEHKQAGWVRRTSGHEASPAHLSLYIGFKGDIAAAGATRQCQWFYDTWSHDNATWDVHPDHDLPRPPILFTSYPSLKDPAHDPGPEQRHTGEIVTFVPWERFQKWQGTRWRSRGEDYEAFKERMAQAMFDVLFEHRPQLRDMVDHYELSTPLSTDLFAKPYKGAIYGLAGTPDRFANPWLRPQSPIPGLFLSGSDVATCGVVGAMMGGAICGLAMEPVKGVSMMRQIVS